MATLPSIKLEQFEGPFDLLVELARKRKVNLSEISLRTITDDFLSYIREHNIVPEIQGDFLVVASTLLLLKVRQLLPSLSEEEEEEVTELTDRIRMYQLYRERSDMILQEWDIAPLYPAHFWGQGHVTFNNEVIYPDISTDALAQRFKERLTKLPKPYHPRAHLTRFGRTLEECVETFRKRLRKVKKLVFQQAMSGTSKQEMAISFLAVLEMARASHVDLHQDAAFGELHITHKE